MGRSTLCYRTIIVQNIHLEDMGARSVLARGATLRTQPCRGSGSYSRRQRARNALNIFRPGSRFHRRSAAISGGDTKRLLASGMRKTMLFSTPR